MPTVITGTKESRVKMNLVWNGECRQLMIAGY